MKKLLVATTALVATLSTAMALEVSLTGEIAIEANISLEKSGFSGVDWDADFTIEAYGESMGWTYGGTMALDMYDGIELSKASEVPNNNSADDLLISTPDSSTVVSYDPSVNDMALQIKSATVFMGSDFMGKIEVTDSCGNFVDGLADDFKMDAADEVGAITGHCAEWTGFNLGGFEVMAAMDLDDNGLIVGAEYLDPTLGRARVEYDIQTNNWDAEIGARLSGIMVSLGVDYNDSEDNSDGDFDYVVAAAGALDDLTYRIAYSPSYILNKDSPDRLGTGQDGVNGYDSWTPATVVTTSPLGQPYGPGAYSFLDSGDGAKALAIGLGYGCYNLSLDVDLTKAVDAKYDAMRSRIPTLNQASASAALGTLASSGFVGALSTPVGTAQTIDAGAPDQGLLSSWELEADCDIHDGVTVSATLGADSARLVALEQANYIESQVDAVYGLAGLSPFTTTTNLNAHTNIKGTVGMKISF